MPFIYFAVIKELLLTHRLLHFQKNKKDALNFDAEFTKEEPVLTPVNADVLRTINQDEFRGFSFVNPEFNPGRFYHSGSGDRNN